MEARGTPTEPLIAAAKYQSYGNDFLLVSAADVPAAAMSSFAQVICRPHLGVGADGCIFFTLPPDRAIELRIFNRDGSEAGMSGNGVRCAAAHCHRRRLIIEPHIEFRTRSGIKACDLLESSGLHWRYQSNMGEPSFRPDQIPVRVGGSLPEEIQDFELEAAGRKLRISALSVGNPQCVIFLDELPEEEEFCRLGAALERHSFFPERTNVSFVRKEGPQELRIRIWERGVGPTTSSGTGCCGAAVAAIQSGRVRSPVQVSTSTGSQQVEWEPGSPISLTGRVDFVADLNYFWSRTEVQ